MLVAPAASACGQSQDDREIVERVVTAYRHSAAEICTSRDSCWSVFFDERHREIHRLFIEGKIESAAKILRNPGDSDLFFGFDGLCLSYQKERLSPRLEEEARICLDGLVRLAEAIGARRLWNPETTYIFSNALRPPLKAVEAETVVAEIERVLGIPLSAPNPFPGERGLLTSRGVVSYRVAPALYQAYRIRQLVHCLPSPRVVEIGAGLGRTAYYARKLGVLDYTIVDIPFTSLSQGYFLGRTLGADDVLLAGETTPDSSRRIKIMTPSAFVNDGSRYDLVLNVDSFTEVGREAAYRYWEHIKSRADVFISINHEGNPFTVREIVSAERHVASTERYPYWMRRGYVEEIVKLR
jgi:hypothetical protein